MYSHVLRVVDYEYYYYYYCCIPGRLQREANAALLLNYEYYCEYCTTTSELRLPLLYELILQVSPADAG